jgi:nicotinate-nucleotide pyrophosphorylase (carboxylating)
MAPDVTQSAATEALIDLALAEDLGDRGDITGQFFIAPGTAARGRIVAREDCVIAGTEIARRVFEKIDPSVVVAVPLADGSPARSGMSVIELAGPAQALLAGERTALNFLQRLSAVATATRRFVDAVEGTGAKILDTRKTTPGWREIEKAAVLAGGGRNHRMGLYDMAMVKDNHLLACGDLAALQIAIDHLRSTHPDARVELEADRLDQVETFLTLRGIDVILLDNMDNTQLRQAVTMRNSAGSGECERVVGSPKPSGTAPSKNTPPALEASGGVTLETIRAIAETGVDLISIGALTHSAPAVDLALDFVE